ncbi:MAG: ATP synthase F1 subunit delta [Lachnospiraceae bacterium]|nr:ATP synthase F1 subunit delta [Lachnospiraceae bacterium]
MAKLISKTYGDALVEIATEKNDPDRVDSLYTEVLSFRKILDENPDFTRLMNHPKLLKEEKVKLLTDVFSGRLDEDLLGLLRVVILNDRYAEIDSILDYFIDAVKEYKGIGVAKVITPFALSEPQKEAVRERLLATTRYSSMEMNYETDESLIGGMVIRIGDRVVDSSIRSRLESLRKSLVNG